MAVLTIRDETVGNAETHEFVLDVITERISVRELIRSRVFQEVKDYNLRAAGKFRGLVRPARESVADDATASGASQPIDWRKQFDVAIEAFEKQQFLILVNDSQLDSLDDEIVITPDTAVSFLRLVVLVGG